MESQSNFTISWKSSDVLRTKLKELSKKIPCCSIQIVFTTNYRIGNLFRFKSPSSLRFKIVNIFKCSRSNSTYVGVTKREEKVWFSEHIEISQELARL